MIRCSKCGRVTKPEEPTGLFVTKNIWFDINKIGHKDIVKSMITCISCSGEETIGGKKW